MAEAAVAGGGLVRRRWVLLWVIGLAQLMVVLDLTVMNIALPSAQRALHFSTVDRQWVVGGSLTRVVLDSNRGGAYLSMLFVSAGLFGTFLFLTYYLQQTLGYSPLVTGVAFLPLSGALIRSGLPAQPGTPSPSTWRGADPGPGRGRPRRPGVTGRSRTSPGATRA
jgi:hypothetical protein